MSSTNIHYKNNPAFSFEKQKHSTTDRKIMVVAAVPFSGNSERSELSFNAGERLVIDEILQGDWYYNAFQKNTIF